MADVHSTLCQVACDVNKMYSFQMFVLINESILYSTATSYTYFNVITAKVIPIELALSLPVYFVARIILIWGMCHLSSELSDESDMFYEQLVTAMRQQYYPCVNEKLTLYVAFRRSVVISAAGIFTVSNSIIASLVETAATYFITLVQLE
ncbi:Hypothetical protein NTJ_09497 [Nesidiocoris tenuis]|uniref:Uncharacterized protein n=1 Tax=Nesidiocoris tenuis TaxID=355587 RepID=A0ABN7AXJ2_9HEMI|nr:Hypothetical protein NTJ_09497 [Nesidiocoris tenuis]